MKLLQILIVLFLCLNGVEMIECRFKTNRKYHSVDCLHACCYSNNSCCDNGKYLIISKINFLFLIYNFRSRYKFDI